MTTEDLFLLILTKLILLGPVVIKLGVYFKQVTSVIFQLLLYDNHTVLR